MQLGKYNIYIICIIIFFNNLEPLIMCFLLSLNLAIIFLTVLFLFAQLTPIFAHNFKKPNPNKGDSYE